LTDFSVADLDDFADAISVALLTDDFTEVTDLADSTNFADLTVSEVFEATDFDTEVAEAFDEAAFEVFDVPETEDFKLFDFESETTDFNEVDD